MNTCPCKPCTRIREIDAQIDALIETDRATDRCDCGEDTITGCGNRPDRHCGLNAEPDTVTIEISVEDAEELVRVVDERDDLRSWLHGGSWTFASELRLKAKLQAALRGEK